MQKGQKKCELKVEAQFETTVSVLPKEDGGQYDLDDWEHGFYEWIEIQPGPEDRYKLPGYSSADVRNPEVNEAEVRTQALKLTYPNDLSDPLSYSFGLSAVIIRISSNESGEFKEIKRMVVSIPMGC